MATADLETPGLLAAALSFTAVLGILFLLPESLPTGMRARRSRSRLMILQSVLRRPLLTRLFAVFFVVTLAFAGMESTFAMWGMRQFGWGPMQIGYVFTYVGLLSAAMQGGLIGPLTRRFGEEQLLLAGLGLTALGLLVLPFARTLPPLGIAVTAMAAGMGAMQPSLNSLISRQAGGEEQGEVMGLAQSVGSLSRVLGPVIAGALFEAFGRSSPYFSGAALVAFALLMSWRLVKINPAAAAAHAPPASRMGPAE